MAVDQRVSHLKLRSVKQESDGGYYRVSFFAGPEGQTLAHSGDVLLRPEEWEVLYWRMMGATLYPEGVSGKVSVQGALPPLAPVPAGATP